MSVGDRLLEFCSLRKVSLKQMCAEAGINYSTLHQQIKKSRPIPFDTIEAVSKRYSADIRFFSQPSTLVVTAGKSFESRATLHSNKVRETHERMMANGRHLTPAIVIDWLRSERGKLSTFETLTDHVDLFRPTMPTDSFMMPTSIGKFSPCSTWFQVHSNEDYLAKVSRFPVEVIGKVVEAHVEVYQSGRYRMEDMTLRLDTPDITLEKDYCRIMANVHDDGGNDLVMVCAFML